MEYLGTEKPINKVMPLVSICIPTYNHVSYISQCIDSILMQQTTFDYEILIGEDNSTDGTRELCKEYARNNQDRIRLFLRSQEDKIWINGKPTGKYNTLSTRKSARGKYIALCDGDDYWTDQNKIQKQADFLEANPKYVITYHDARIVDEANNFLSNRGLPEKLKKDGDSYDIISGKWMPTLTVMFRNGLISEPTEIYNKILNGDTFLYTLLAPHGKAKYQSNIAPSHYRKHSGGIWSALAQRKKYEELINTRSRLLPIVNKKYKWAIKQPIYHDNVMLALYLPGISSKIKQYVTAYKYWTIKPGAIKLLLSVHGEIALKLLKKLGRPTKRKKTLRAQIL